MARPKARMKPGKTQQDKAQEIVKRAERGVKFIMHGLEVYPAPTMAVREVLDHIVTFAMDKSNKETTIATQASFAIRAAWQFGYLQKAPNTKLSSDTVPMLLGSITNIPTKAQKRIGETSASLYASLRAGGDHLLTAVRSHIYVMYGYGHYLHQEEAKRHGNRSTTGLRPNSLSLFSSTLCRTRSSRKKV